MSAARPVAPRRRAWTLAIALAALGFVAADPYAGLDLYARVLSRVESSALVVPSREELVYSSLRGMVAALDPHSAFFDPASWARVQAASDGVYVGIGAETRAAACGERVVEVVAGGPAASGGILPGECLVAVEGRSLAGLDAETSGALLHGEDGSVATLVVESADGGGRRTVAVLRARVVAPLVVRTEVGARPLVLRLRQVGDRAPEELARALDAAPEAAARGLVLDVRGNPGGRLDRAVAVVDAFVSAGTIVTVRGPGGEKVWSATAAATDRTMPLIVLIDGDTASAAELLAGALRDLGRARIVGTRSYGKGTVQGFYPFEGGATLKLTEARYYLPKGEPVVDHEGLVPDVEVRGPGVDPGARLRAHIGELVGVSAAERERLYADVDALAAPVAPVAPAGDAALVAALALLETGR